MYFRVDRLVERDVFHVVLELLNTLSVQLALLPQPLALAEGLQRLGPARRLRRADSFLQSIGADPVAVAAVLLDGRADAVERGVSSIIDLPPLMIGVARGGRGRGRGLQSSSELRGARRLLRTRLDAPAEARVDDYTKLAARRAQLLGLAPGARRPLEWRLRRAAAEDALEEQEST